MNRYSGITFLLRISFVTFVLLLFVNFVFSQKQDVFKFVARYNNYNDTSPVKDLSKEIFFNTEFYSNRKYFSDSVFTDSNIICSFLKEECLWTFKKTSTGWYTKINNKWQLLFSNKKNRICHINLRNNKWEIQPLEVKMINNILVYKFSIINKNDYESIDRMFWFNPAYGIIATVGQFYTFVRVDVFGE